MAKSHATIDDVKGRVEHCRGCRVALEAHRSKKKLYQKEGVIKDTYPNIFTISVQEEQRGEQILTFSYSDLLTRSVKIHLLELPPCAGGETAPVASEG